jgi:solute carrier family 35 protein F5
MPVWKVASLSLVFGIVWFFANYLYALALVSKTVALVNTLSSMSSVFVMLMAALPLLHRAPGDRITLSRFLVTLLSVGGAILVSISDSEETEHKYWSTGALLALASAFLYAVYLVLLKKLVPDPDTLELPMFFGFVGLFNTILLLPLVLLWHYTGLEEFEWPPDPAVWTLLLINGMVGTVISELVWLGGVFLTSPLVGSLSLALVTPLSISYSVFVGQNPFSVMFFVGALIVVICFVIVTVLDHFGSWDPLWALIKKIVIAVRDYRDYDVLSEESKRLIDSEDNSSADQCTG